MGLESHWWDMSCVPIPVAMSLHRAILPEPSLAPQTPCSKGQQNCLCTNSWWERSQLPTNTGRRLRQRFPKQLSAGIRERLCLDRLQLWVAAG